MKGARHEAPAGAGAAPIPAGVSQVEGCNCGGVTRHRTDCSLWEMGDEQAAAAISDAEARITAYVANLTPG